MGLLFVGLFQLLFKYPASAFAKGELVLLGRWPVWVLVLLLITVPAGLAVVVRARVPHVLPSLRNWRVGVIWLLESALAALLLLLLWQPALTVAELKPQQTIVAVLIDDSRSMSIPDHGASRIGQAVNALDSGALRDLQRSFQTRLYRFDNRLSRISSLETLQATSPATRMGDSLKQLVDETAGLPVGAVVVLSDGGDNTGGIDLETLSALRSRRIPVHTVGLGEEHLARDIEIDDVDTSSRALANSRLAATVRFHQRGFTGRKATLRVGDGGKQLASREVTLAADGAVQAENLQFNVGAAGAKNLQFSVDPLPGEENVSNNTLARLVSVEAERRRILYIEGEPRWEYKFIRRAEDDDRLVRLVSMLRTTESKTYRQGIENPNDLAEGFPSRAEDLFGYQGLIVGSVEASYFTPAQQDLIRRFVDQRGGGLLLLGGRYALADGGWSHGTLADLLPVTLPDHADTFHRGPATATLTPAGADAIICGLAELPDRNLERWKKLPFLMNYQEVGAAKPGAAVLAEMEAGGRKMPLLATENFGRGRTAVLATAGTWRWRMGLAHDDRTHEIFWQQLLRWLVADTRGQVVASVPSQMLFDEGRVQLSAEVRDKDYLAAPDAQVEARIAGPQGSSTVELTPDPATPGVFHGEWNAENPGSYATEIIAKRGQEELGRDRLTIQRLDGVAENFHTEQNRPLLEKLAAETGGRYWHPGDLNKLAREIPYSQAGITLRETKDLWNMPIVFVLILALRSTEWILRRRWGSV